MPDTHRQSERESEGAEGHGTGATLVAVLVLSSNAGEGEAGVDGDKVQARVTERVEIKCAQRRGEPGKRGRGRGAPGEEAR